MPLCFASSADASLLRAPSRALHVTLLQLCRLRSAQWFHSPSVLLLSVPIRSLVFSAALVLVPRMPHLAVPSPSPFRYFLPVCFLASRLFTLLDTKLGRVQRYRVFPPRCSCAFVHSDHALCAVSYPTALTCIVCSCHGFEDCLSASLHLVWAALRHRRL